MTAGDEYSEEVCLCTSVFNAGKAAVIVVALPCENLLEYNPFGARLGGRSGWWQYDHLTFVHDYCSVGTSSLEAKFRRILS